ncbi:MAG: dihydroorotase [Alphaproteobacteria bacterium]|nr:dihydroorotase [Alphaproteobacteria bacterium]
MPISFTPISFTLPKWYDLHTHMRQGALLAPMVEQHLKMGCAGILAMPNTKPPVAKVLKNDAGADWSIEQYLSDLRAAGGDQFSDIIVPLYLTANTTPKMIADGAKTGLLRAVKYYPPHGTTNSEHSVTFDHFIGNGVFAALEEHGVVLCIHGERSKQTGEDYFGRTSNAEEKFYDKHMHLLCATYPKLKIVAEHITTKVAADFVHGKGPNVVATITPQHMLYNLGHMLQGLKYHLYCMPLVKFEDDRKALCAAATDPVNTKFFAGTDSAPHSVKSTPCGCAAGCYTGGIAPQLYADAFEGAGVDLSTPAGQNSFIHFLCKNGAYFYGLPVPKETFTLTKTPQEISVVKTELGTITPLPIGMLATPATSTMLNWTLTL